MRKTHTSAKELNVRGPRPDRSPVTLDYSRFNEENPFIKVPTHRAGVLYVCSECKRLGLEKISDNQGAAVGRHPKTPTSLYHLFPFQDARIVTGRALNPYSAVSYLSTGRHARTPLALASL